MMDRGDELGSALFAISVSLIFVLALACKVATHGWPTWDKVFP
jgi:hypothetical protein